MSDLYKHAAANGYDLPKDFPMDGKPFRFSVNGSKEKDGYLQYFTNSSGVHVCLYGDWKTRPPEVAFKWCNRDKTEMTPTEQIALEKEILEAQARAEKQRAEEQTATAKKAQRIWDKAKSADPKHPHLIKKIIKPKGLKQLGKALVCRVQSPDGILTSLQFIGPNGTKRFLRNGKTSGGCSSLKGSKQLVVCEGPATGASLHEATGATVVCAFNCGNMLAVAKAIREKHPNGDIVIAGDDDIGTKGNPGRTKATAAAKAIGAKVVFPEFQSDTAEGTDFNDLMLAEGIETVRKQLGKLQAEKAEDVPKIDPESSDDTNQKDQDNREIGFRLVQISEIKTRVPEWVVKNMMELDTLIEIFGDPASGKSFLAVDFAACVASGKDFVGKKVRQGPVIYIAGEGQNGIKRRFKAWAIRHDINLDQLLLFVSLMPAGLCDEDQRKLVLAAIDTTASQHGEPVLVVIDTVARNFGPGDENSTKDMGMFIQAVDAIRSAHRSTILLVHHSGHSDKSRARGAMALKGALDAEYRLDRDSDGIIRCECVKMKDFEIPESVAFKLRTVELGIADEDGEQITSAVLDPTGYEPRVVTGKTGKGKNQAVGMEVLRQLFNERRRNLESGGFDPRTARVSVKEWGVACKENGMSRQAFSKIRGSLQQVSLVKIEHGFVELI